MDKNSFMLNQEHKEIFETLSKEDAGSLILAIFEYEQTGKEPELAGNLKFAFIPIRQWLDKCRKAYEKKCKVNAKNGSLGGRGNKRIEANESEISERFLDKAKKGEYEYDYDNDKYIDDDEDLCARTHDAFNDSFGIEPTPEEITHIVKAVKLLNIQDLLAPAIQRAASFGAKTPTSYIVTILEEWSRENITSEEELADYLILCDCRDRRSSVMSREEAVKKLKQSKAARQLLHKGVV